MLQSGSVHKQLLTEVTVAFSFRYTLRTLVRTAPESRQSGWIGLSPTPSWPESLLTVARFSKAVNIAMKTSESVILQIASYYTMAAIAYFCPPSVPKLANSRGDPFCSQDLSRPIWTVCDFLGWKDLIRPLDRLKARKEAARIFTLVSSDLALLKNGCACCALHSQ